METTREPTRRIEGFGRPFLLGTTAILVLACLALALLPLLIGAAR